MARTSLSVAILLSLVSLARADVTLTLGRRSAGVGAPANTGQDRLLVSGSEVRMELLSGESPLAPPGGHLLSHDGGRTYTIVDPETRTYWKQGHVSAKTRRLVTSLFGRREKSSPVTVDEIVVEPLGEEDGGTILGHATRLHRFRIRFRVNASPLFGPREGGPPTVTSMDGTDDNWFAPALPEDETARRLFLVTGFAETDRALARAVASARGLPLRRAQKQKSVSGGTTLADTTTFVEVEDIRFEALSPSSFEPPVGYRKVRWEDALARRMRAPEPRRNP